MGAGQSLIMGAGQAWPEWSPGAPQFIGRAEMESDEMPLRFVIISL